MRYLCIALVFIFLSTVSPLYAGSEDYELYIAQGIQKINQGKTKDAIVLLRKALKLTPESPEAAYYAGVAYSINGNYKEAESLFLQTLQLDETSANAYLELGRIYYVTSRCDDLEELLSKFIDRSKDKALKGEAAELVDGCRNKAEEKPYRLDISAGTQYDSNVILEPSNPPVSAERKSDTRAVLYVTSGAVLLKDRVIKLTLDYNFYQSLHMNLNEFNVQYHKITPVLEMTFSDALRSSVGYSLEYTLLGSDLYSRFHTFYGKFTVKESEKLSTEAIYEYRSLKYWDGDIFQTNSIRTGYQNTVGIKQNFYLNRLSGEIYYFSDFNRAKEGYWAFDGQRLGAELAYKITPHLHINVSGEYNERRYHDDFPGFQEKRLDRMQQYSLRLIYFISERMSASVTESYTVNDSNIALFNYKRNITGIFLTIDVL
ncbi:MAG: tetratricopeptide repeat protein [Nitrospirota bacterium]|nr:tetratricopeptide repeat protein [Nitrospirota bacterium]